MRVKPKKSLGQNFLIDANIRSKIINACSLTTLDTVLEIGAGSGELTASLAERAARVIALEIDRNLAQILRDKFRDRQNVEVINADILKFDPAKIIGAHDQLKVIGNIPYYISTPIIETLIGWRERIKVVYLTTQKEFARRITQGPGTKDYGSFSCYTQFYSSPRIIFFIKKTSFYPAPKVDSAFLELVIRKEPPVELKDERLFFQIIRRAFGQRRKTLRSSLKGKVEKDTLDTFFKKYNMSRDIRPEMLSLKDFANLANILKIS